MGLILYRRVPRIAIFLSLIFLLSGCIGEDYDVGVPTAHLSLELMSVKLAEGNISWKTASEDVQYTVNNIEEIALSEDEIVLWPNQLVSINFEENEENGGDIFTDEKVTASLLKDDQRVDLELNDVYEFNVPTESGNYVLEVNFKNSAGEVQYLGNVRIN